MSTELVAALGAVLLLAAGAIGWLLRDRTARKPATERADQAAVDLLARQQDAAVVRQHEQERALARGIEAAKLRQEIGTHASETIDQTAERLGSGPAPVGRLRQESAPGSDTPKRRP